MAAALVFQMRIYFRWAALVAAVGAAIACARARPADQPAFRGFYMVGPYRSAFRPCGSDEEWFVALSTASAGLELQRRTRMMMQDSAPPGGMRRTQAPAGDAGGFHRAYVEVQGDTVALTAGPELGRYTGELRLTGILDVRRVAEAKCP